MLEKVSKMSLEGKLGGWLEDSRMFFSRLVLAGMLGITLSGAQYGCGKQESEEGQPEDYLTVTKDGMPVCPLGWGILGAGVIE